jgi:hypothetical protein
MKYRDSRSSPVPFRIVAALSDIDVDINFVVLASGVRVKSAKSQKEEGDEKYIGSINSAGSSGNCIPSIYGGW